MKSISIIGDGAIACPNEIYIEDCDLLETITFKNYDKVNKTGACTFTVKNCPKLKTLDLSNTAITSLILTSGSTKFNDPSNPEDFSALEKVCLYSCQKLKTLYAGTTAQQAVWENSSAEAVHIENIKLNSSANTDTTATKLTGTDGISFMFKYCAGIETVYMSNVQNDPNLLGN